MRKRSVSFGVFLLILAGFHIALAPASQVAAQAPDPLSLTITAERSECTAGTLNPLSWEIRGGVAPYRLTVDGASVDADAESTTVTCSALPTGATEALGTITAVVTDAAGATATASAAYTIVPPLPAPTGLKMGEVLRYQVGVNWDAVEGAGSQSPVVREHGWDGSDSYLFRYRAAEADATTPYEYLGPLRDRGTFVRPDPLDADGDPITTGDYLGMAAAIRHTIEQESPAALNWSAPIPFGVLRAPENIVVQASHDTVNVAWDEQPYTQSWTVSLVGGGFHLYGKGWDITPTDGRHHTRFRHLTPETEYEITITIGGPLGAVSTATTVRTAATPADWQPLPEGPQNLRATATHDSITVRWDPPFPEGDLAWSVNVTTTLLGRTWVVQNRVIRTPPPEGWTLRGLYQPIRPNTTYRVRVANVYRPGPVVEISVTTPAARPPLRLSLTAERADCTAATLNPVTWAISGGVEPYRLTVDGASVDADAESATVTCGALPDDASDVPGARSRPS